MSILVLNAADVEALLDMHGCIDAMAGALAALARGEYHLPLRPIVRPPDSTGILGLMPAYRGGERPLYALKTVAIFPANAARGLDPHQGCVTLYSGRTGELVAVMNASPITAIRTAACSAVATRLLARQDARELAIVGAGHQARAHIEAMLAVRDFEHIRIASRTRANAEALAAAFANAQAAQTVEEAVREADVIVTVTTAAEPVIRREWLKPGAHVNAVGACFPTTRELDSATMAAASVFVDSREAATHESGDYLLALAEGAIARDHVKAEIGEVLVGAHPGRTSRDELTVFESLGLAVEDLAAAEYLVHRAAQSGVGTTMPF